MTLKYLLISFLLFAFFACSKKGSIESNGESSDSSQNIQDYDSSDLSPFHIEKALFMDPDLVKTHSSDTTIMHQLIEYFNRAPKGSVVHISIYLFNYQPLINAVKKAYKNGVEIHLLIDNSRPTSQESNQETIPTLKKLFESPSEVVVVTNDISSTSINHEKVVLFSELDFPNDTAKNVVFSTSHNFTLSSTEKVQDAIVMTNKGLYDAFIRNWNSIKFYAHSGMSNFKYTVDKIGDSIIAYFFPRRENGHWDGLDTYIQILNKINDYSNAKVRVIMSDWSRVEVAKKLSFLTTLGVQVEVITKDKSGNSESIEELKNNMVPDGGDLYIVPMSKENTHSKIVLIKGTWNGVKQEILCTGSHNFTYNALKRNNEVLLLMKNSILFDKYWDYFDDLKSTLLFK